MKKSIWRNLLFKIKQLKKQKITKLYVSPLLFAEIYKEIYGEDGVSTDYRLKVSGMVIEVNTQVTNPLSVCVGSVKKSKASKESNSL